MGNALAGRLKLVSIGIASVLAGGTLAIWWYRNTLQKLRQASEAGINTDFGISDAESEEEN